MANDGVLDSWEDFADVADIDKRVEEGLSISSGSRPKLKETFSKKKCSSDPNLKGSFQKERSTASPQPSIKILQRQRPLIHEEDQNRTPFIPQLKILKRPEKSSDEQRSAEEKKRLASQQPVPTLAEREAAYAEARQRIMGVEVNNGSSKTYSADSRPDNLKRYSKQKVHQNGYSNDVKRQPKGPGSGRGFKNNR